MDFWPGKHAKICISFQLIVGSQVQGPPGGPNSTQLGVVAAKLQPSECWSPSAMFDMQPQHDHCSKSGSDGLVGKLMLHIFKHISGLAAIGCCINMLSSHQHGKKCMCRLLIVAVKCWSPMAHIEPTAHVIILVPWACIATSMCVLMQQSAVVHLCCVHGHTWISHAVEAASSQTCTQCATSTNSWQPWLNGCCHVTEHGVHCHHQLASGWLEGCACSGHVAKCTTQMLPGDLTYFHRAACQLLPSSQLLAFNVAIAVAAILVT
jgi:hypothetical protein